MNRTASTRRKVKVTVDVWNVFWFIFIFVPLSILWVITLLDVFWRPDLVGWQKAIWVMVIIFFPWIGVFAYLILRPRGAPFPTSARGSAPASPAYTAQSTPQPTPQPAPTPVPAPASGDAGRAMP